MPPRRWRPPPTSRASPMPCSSSPSCWRWRRSSSLVWRSLLRRRRDLLAIDALRRNAEAISAELPRSTSGRSASTPTPRMSCARRSPSCAPASMRWRRATTSAHLKRDVDGMIRQVELLLELARTETVTTGADARIDLGRLAQDMAARLYPVARRAGRDIAVEAPPRAVVGDRRSRADGKRRAQPARERLAGLAVRCHGAPGGGRGSAAPGGRRPRAGPRSRRSAGADRAVPARPEGRLAGLGLAIVAEAAKRLKAQLSLARTDEAGGATFSLIFPR